MRTRPTEIFVKLKQNGATYQEKTVKANSEGKWLYGFNSLPKYDESGKEYRYALEEKQVALYEAPQYVGHNIINKYRNTEKISVSGEKTWDDYENKFKTRPAEITVDLLVNGHKKGEQKVEANGEGKWIYSFTDLPKYDASGDEIIYTVNEQPVKNYTAAINGYSINNTYRNTETVSKVGEKKWDDYDNKHQTRPTAIDVILRQNTKKFKRLTISQDVAWKYEFTDLPKYDEKGNLYTYELTEEMPTGKEYYDLSLVGDNMVNTYRNTETVDIDVVKIWDDHNNSAGKRPKGITMYLLQNKKIDRTNQSLVVTGDEHAEQWQGEFKNLPKYDEDGDLYEYDIVEEPISEFRYTQSKKQREANKVTFTNRYRNEEKIKINGTLTWNDYDNKFNTRPNEINLELYRNDQPDVVLEKIAVDGNMATYEFTGEYDLMDNKLAEPYIYTVKQSSSDPRFTSYQKEVIGTDFINSYQTQAKVNLNGAIEWSDYENKFETRPKEVTLHLYRDGTKVGEEKVQAENADDFVTPWKIERHNLKRFDEHGHEYKYSVLEDVSSIYTKSISMTPDVLMGKNIPTDTDKNYDVIIKNNYVNKEKTVISANKIWDDYQNKFDTRPEKVNFTLSGNNKEITEEVTASTGESDIWSHSFNELDKYDNQGNQIDYVVDEEDIPNYTKTINQTNINNKYTKEDQISFKGSIGWNDYQNKFKTRPNELSIYLLRNNEIVKEIKSKIDGEGNWSYDFAQKFDVYDELGEKYTYQVVQESPGDYTTTSENTSDFLNTYVNDDTKTIKGDLLWVDYLNKFDTRPEKVTLTLSQNDNKKYQTKQIQDTGLTWHYEFAEVPVYDEFGEPYLYKVAHENIVPYETTKIGNYFINRYENKDQINISTKVNWNDKDNKLATRPSDIQVTLYRNNRVYSEEVITDNDGWEAMFENVPQYDIFGNLYNYDIRTTIINDYQTEIKMDDQRNIHFDINSSYLNPEKIVIQGEKKWNDQENKLGKRPEEISVLLVQNGQKVIDKDTSTNQNGQWSYEFAEVPKYDANLDSYEYQVKEEKVADYLSKNTGYDLINTYDNKELTSVQGDIVWDDQQNRLEKRPEEVKITLYRNNEPIKTKVVSAAQNWHYEFNELLVYDKYLDKNTYTVKQEKIANYDTKYDDFNIFNTFINDENIDVTGKVIWDDKNNKLESRPETVYVELFKKGEETSIASVETTAETNWEYTFKDILKYNADLIENEYIIRSSYISGYFAEVDETNIKAHYLNEATVDMTGAITWFDKDNKLSTRPEKATIELFKQGEDKVILTEEINLDSNWGYNFKSLPKYNSELEEINYSIKVQPIASYKVEVKDNNIEAYYLNEETTDYKVTVVWEDENNKSDTRPQESVIELNSNKKEPLITKDKENWYYQFSELPKYDEQLNVINYQFEAKDFDNYEKEVVGNTVYYRLKKEKEIVPPIVSPTDDNHKGKTETSKKKKENKGGFLPKTNEIKSLGYSYIGNMLLIIFVIGFYKKRRKEEK